jgi:hypothetical protein
VNEQPKDPTQAPKAMGISPYLGAFVDAVVVSTLLLVGLTLLGTSTEQTWAIYFLSAAIVFAVSLFVEKEDQRINSNDRTGAS